MLYKNGKQYMMTDSEKAFLKKEFTFPVYLRYPSRLIKRNKLNPLPDKPAGIDIPLKSIVYEEGTTAEWRWAQNESRSPQGIVRYMPRILAFQGSWSITDLELDLLYFLYFKSPYCENGHLSKIEDGRQAKKPYFTIEDLVKAASEKVNTRKLMARVNTLIDDDELGLPESKLRALAKAYFIPNVDSLTLDQVRVVLDLEVKRDKQNGLQTFIKMSDSSAIIQVRGKIRTAVDMGIVRFNPTKKQWNFVNEDKTEEPICKVNKIEPQAGLVEFYGGDKEFAKRLDAELEGINATKVVEKVVKSEGEIIKV